MSSIIVINHLGLFLFFNIFPARREGNPTNAINQHDAFAMTK